MAQARLTTGTILQNRYRIVSLLGQGGMGAVYRAWDTRLNIPAALKEMTPQPGLDPQTLTQLRQQFQQEATVLARMNHLHLVRVTDFFEEWGNTYLVMDFVEGKNLADHIARQGPLPETQVLAWAGQLLDALAYCHAQGVIHRDVKPQNVVIRPDGQAMLVDFGLVKLWDPHDPRTRTAMRGMGTPEYAPPEQYEAGMGHTDPRSDVYGLGATLYHALAGQAPPTATLRMAAPEQFVPVRGLNPSVSPATEMAILRAMEMARSQRWQNADEMAAALGIAGPPHSAQPPGRIAPAVSRRDKTRVMPGVQPVVPTRRRAPVWVWVLGGAALLLCLLCAGTVWRVGRFVREDKVMMTAHAVQVTARSGPTASAQATQVTSTAQAAQATATARSRARATTQAQTTATAIADVQATAAAASHWPVVLYDDFGTNANDWPTGDYSGERVTGDRRLTNGKYRWEANALDSVSWRVIPDTPSISDFYLTVEVRQISGTEDARYGIVFRCVDHDNYYLFRTRNDQYYQFSSRYKDEWNTLIGWTKTSAIRPGEVNRLTVIAEGPHFIFYVNDQYVGKADDTRLNDGKSGLTISLDDPGDTAVFEFDNFEVRAP